MDLTHIHNNGGKLHKQLYDWTITNSDQIKDLRWVKHVAYIGETRNADKDLGNDDDDNNKQDVRYIHHKHMNLSELSQNRILQWERAGEGSRAVHLFQSNYAAFFLLNWEIWLRFTTFLIGLPHSIK